MSHVIIKITLIFIVISDSNINAIWKRFGSIKLILNTKEKTIDMFIDEDNDKFGDDGHHKCMSYFVIINDSIVSSSS